MTPRFSVFFAAALPACTALAADCLLFNLGQRVNAVTSPKNPACFLVTVEPGEAAQISVEQPDDLVLHLQGTDRSIVVDGFEFGRETVTISIAGQYRLEVRTGHPSTATPPTFLMSRTALQLHLADGWSKAEAQATRSKQSRLPGDIAESLKLWTSVNNPSAVARTHLEYGGAMLRAGNATAARHSYEDALTLCRSLSDERCVAEAANNSGLTAQRLGDFNAALERFTEAAESWQHLSSRLEGRTLSNLGLLFWQTGDYQRAIASYDRARLILHHRDPLGHTKVLNNLGLCYLSLGEYEQARGYFRRAITEASQLKSANDTVIAQLNLGRAYMLDGSLQRAQTILERALTEAIKHPNQPIHAGVLNNLGQTLWRRRLFEQSTERLRNALELHKQLGDRRGQASDLHYLGLNTRARGKNNEARELLAQAAQIRRDCGLRDDEVDSLFALAELDFDTGNSAGARALAEQAIPLLESVRSQVPGHALRASYYSRKRRLLDLLVAVAVASDNSQASIEGLLAAERGRARALLDLLAEGSLLRKVPQELTDRRVRIRQQIDLLSLRLAGMAPEAGADLRQRVQLLLAEDKQVEAAIRESLGDVRIARPLDSVARLQSEYLPADTALLEFHLGERKSYLWLVRANSIRAFPLPPRATIENQVARMVHLFGDILGRRRYREKHAAFERATRLLSQTLLGPLGQSQLPPRLILVLDGALHRVPFSALWTPRRGDRLGLAHDLVQIPAAAYLMTGRPPRPVREFPKTILALADPVFSNMDARVVAAASSRRFLAPMELPRLPFTEELNTIAKLVRAPRRQILRGFDANVNALRQILLSDFAFLHLSTHATIDDRIPELSRITLSMIDRAGRPVDGLLRPYQLSDLRLNGSTVVLSACDTALGKQVLGEGLAGFTTSLFHAGVSQLVLTLTKVDAQASSLFFSDVYQRIFARPPVVMERALTQARRVFARSARWSDPYYWASFTLIGQPSRTVERQMQTGSGVLIHGE